MPFSTTSRASSTEVVAVLPVFRAIACDVIVVSTGAWLVSPRIPSQRSCVIVPLSAAGLASL